MSQIAAFVLGCVFVVVGRWLYAHPHRLAPQWWLGAKSKSSRDFARFLGILFVFVGSASAGFSLFGTVLGGVGEVILALGCATVVTWLTFRRTKAERETPK